MLQRGKLTLRVHQHACRQPLCPEASLFPGNPDRLDALLQRSRGSSQSHPELQPVMINNQPQNMAALDLFLLFEVRTC